MSEKLNHRSAERRSLIRPVTAMGATLGATLVALMANAVPALAGPQPLDPDTSGPAALPVATVTTLPAGMTTGEVVIISLLISVAVAAVVVGIAFLLRHLFWPSASGQIPTQRTSVGHHASPEPVTKLSVGSR